MVEDQHSDLSFQKKRPEYFDFLCSSNGRKVNIGLFLKKERLKTNLPAGQAGIMTGTNW